MVSLDLHNSVLGVITIVSPDRGEIEAKGVGNAKRDRDGTRGGTCLEKMIPIKAIRSIVSPLVTLYFCIGINRSGRCKTASMFFFFFKYPF